MKSSNRSLFKIPTITIILTVVIYLFSGCSTLMEMQEPEKKQKQKVEVKHDYAFDFVNVSTLSEALDLAKEQNKLVFVDLYTDWCLPCKLMDQDVFSHRPTAEQINKDFISFRVDGDSPEGQDLVIIFQAKSFPTLLFLDTKGRVLAKRDGAVYHKELLEMAKEAKLNYQ